MPNQIQHWHSVLFFSNADSRVSLPPCHLQMDSRATTLVPAGPRIEHQLSPVSRRCVFPFLAVFFCWLHHFIFLISYSPPLPTNTPISLLSSWIPLQSPWEILSGSSQQQRSKQLSPPVQQVNHLLDYWQRNFSDHWPSLIDRDSSWSPTGGPSWTCNQAPAAASVSLRSSFVYLAHYFMSLFTCSW